MVAATKSAIIQKAMQKDGTLTDEAIRNGSLKKNTEKRGNGGEKGLPTSSGLTRGLLMWRLLKRRVLLSERYATGGLNRPGVAQRGELLYA
ncbi:hypothetical protein Tco_1058477 [Tanacetum coccineum]|uniref:Uncharacterized protein n=1 Tax=Tanacetum coccineum TaxID=301880 RepID=A0ABQ5H9V5_9ASTR